MKAASNDKEISNILIGSSSIAIKKLNAVALLSIKNFKENCNANKIIGSKNLKGMLAKKFNYIHLSRPIYEVVEY